MGILHDTYIINESPDMSPMYRQNELIKEHNKIIKENTELEIKARDRVDLSLEEYSQLVKENDTLKNKLQSYDKLLNDIGKHIGMDPKILLNCKVTKLDEINNANTYEKQFVLGFSISRIELDLIYNGGI